MQKKKKLYFYNIYVRRIENIYIFIHGAHCAVNRIKDGLRVQVKPLGQSMVDPGQDFLVKRSPFQKIISPHR